MICPSENIKVVLAPGGTRTIDHTVNRLTPLRQKPLNYQACMCNGKDIDIVTAVAGYDLLKVTPVI